MTEPESPTKEEQLELSDAITHIKRESGASVHARHDVWAAFFCDFPEQFDNALSAIEESTYVCLYHADRGDGFVSVVLEDYKNEVDQ